MSEFIMVLMAVATFAWIAYPLLMKRSNPLAVPENDDELEALYSQRNTTYSMLKELEFDHSSGILTDEDFKELDSRYKSKAVSILKGIDEQVNDDGLEDEIEQQIRRIRHGKQSAVSLEDEIEEQVRSFRSKNARLKQAPADLEDEIERRVSNSRASHDVPAQATSGRGIFCPQCGAKIGNTARFCRHCGTKLD